MYLFTMLLLIYLYNRLFLKFIIEIILYEIIL